MQSHFRFSILFTGWRVPGVSADSVMSSKNIAPFYLRSLAPQSCELLPLLYPVWCNININPPLSLSKIRRIMEYFIKL